MKSIHHLQTMAWTYQEICRGQRPWTALGNFMNDWFDYEKDRLVIFPSHKTNPDLLTKPDQTFILP